MRFTSFLDKKHKEAKRELGIIRDVLSEGDMEVQDFLNEKSPYIFLKNSKKELNFEGVRIYKVGSNIAYRVQNEKDTEPYGSAYSLDIEDAFGDLITDMNEDKAAEKIKKALIQEFKNFFKLSKEAQEELNSTGRGDANIVIIGGKNGDLSNYM
jgi:hypothetical protein